MGRTSGSRESSRVPGADAETWDHEREMEHWRDEYMTVKEKLSQPSPGQDISPLDLEALGILEGLEAQDERRGEPRYSFKPCARIFAHLGPREFPILNISVGGISFYSDILFKPGTTVLMSALGMIAIEVEILDSTMEETDPNLMEYRYRVRAKFGPMVNGYQVYVLARELYLEQMQDQ